MPVIAREWAGAGDTCSSFAQAAARRSFCVLEEMEALPTGDGRNVPPDPGPARDVSDAGEPQDAFAAAFHHSPAAMLLTHLDGRIIEMNEHFLQTSGYERDELAGRRARETGMIAVDAGIPLMVALDRSGRLPVTEVEITRRDGSRRTVLASTETITHRGERCRLSVFTDITERKRSERRLALQNELSRELLEGDDLAVIGPRILQRLCGADGWSAAVIWLTNGLGPRRCVAVSCVPGGGSERLEIPIECRGETFGALEVAWSGQRLIDNGTSDLLEAIAQMVGLHVARQRATAALQQMNGELEQRVAARTQELAMTNRDLEAFNYSISHELRAPLRAITGFAAVLAEDHSAELSPTAVELLAKVQAGGIRLRALVDDLLAFAQLGRDAIAPRAFNVTSLVTEVATQVEHDRGTEGRYQLTIGNLLPCAGDPMLLRQVWMNLLDNAFKYSRERELAVIDVSSEPLPGAVRYCVRDNGAGFDMACADRLFGVFQRLHPASRFEGTGVGLAHVRRIVERHGGQVWAEAVPGGGAAFCFTLPIPAVD